MQNDQLAERTCSIGDGSGEVTTVVVWYVVREAWKVRKARWCGSRSRSRSG